MAGPRDPRPLPPLERLRHCFDYNPDTGMIVWRHRPEVDVAWNARQAGKPAGCVTGSGYRQIRLDGMGHRYHRIAWALFHGEDPGDLTVDHKDGDRLNNKIENLRLATTSQQGCNKPKQAGDLPRGVEQNGSRFTARIRVEGRRVKVFGFASPSEAHQAYREMARKYHGEFARFD